MDFREFAAKEASDLAARLTKAAADAAEAALRRAKDDAQKAADALRGEVKAATDQKAALAESLKDAQAHVKEAQAQVKEAQTQIDVLRADLKTSRDEKNAAATAFKDAQAQAREAQAQAERLRGELKAASDRVETAGRHLEDARRNAGKLEAARDEQAAARKSAEADLRNTRDAADSLRSELASATAAIEKATAERHAAEEAVAHATSQSQAAEVKLTAVTDLFKKSAARVKVLEQAQQQHEKQIHDLEAKAHASSAAAPAAAPLGALDDLLAGFQALGAATTIGDVLTTLVEQMACQFPRVALFRLRKGHLQGEHQIGFDLKNDIGKLVLPLGMDSLPSRAASSGQIESLAGDELKDSRTPFTGAPGCALAIPIVVGRETLAVVYADDSGASKRAQGGRADEVHVRYAEAMRQYAVAVLMRLNNELKALAELQKYAVSLLHELEQMYVADVESGLSGGDLQKRLAGNLDYARSIYGSRTALESADAATLVDDELASLIEVRKGTPFARDLAAAAGHMPARSAAEAS